MSSSRSPTRRSTATGGDSVPPALSSAMEQWAKLRESVPTPMRTAIDDLLSQVNVALKAEDSTIGDRSPLQQLIELADVSMLMLDEKGNIRLINQEACRLLGYEPAQLKGRNWFDTCIPETQRERVRTVFKKLLSGDTQNVDRYENDVLTHDGKAIPISWHNVLLRDAQGNAAGTLSSGRDRTQERKTERALTESEEQLRGIFNTTVDAIITISEAGIMQSFNPAAQRMFGYTAQEAIGRNVVMLMPEPYRKEHDEYLHRYRETGIRHIIGIGREVLGLRKNGTTFPIDLAVSEAKLGDCRTFTGILRDISERKRLEREVLDVSTQERERIGRDLHDGLGQELTGIAFLAGVLQRNLRTKGLAEADNAGEIVKLVNTTIDHTRALVKGLCPVTMDPDGLMNSLRGLADMVQEVHDIACQFDCPRPVWIADHHFSTHLFYIAQEAVNNAIKHGKPTEVTIGLYSGRGIDTLRIADNGKGMAPDTPRDSGRGMHIMQHRAKMIGASLDVISAPDRGTIISCAFEHRPNIHASTRNIP